MTDFPIILLDSYLQRITAGLREYTQAYGFTKVLVGSSGGIDSALTIALAAHALGPKNVTAITMPSVFSSVGSVTDSQKLCGNLGVELLECPIRDIVDQISASMADCLGLKPAGVPLENLQARARGIILMTYSNTHGHLLLTTGNKSEALVGYCTLYGDTCGGLNLIGDMYKTEVYAFSRYLNQQARRELIPASILEKAPSAELAPGQKDEDSLPPYPILDAVLQKLVEPAPESSRAVDRLQALPDAERQAVIDRVQQLVVRSEFKRRQMAPSIRLRGAPGLTSDPQ